MLVTMKELLEAGVHFGHQTRRWNPKMRPYVFMERNGIHIIDLQKTLQMLERAYQAVQEVSREGETVLFVGTKRQAKDVVREAAQSCGMPYVTERWLGGTLTNFQTIRKSVAKLEELDRMSQDGTYERLPKKEVLHLEKRRAKLQILLGGIRDMTRLPGMLYVVDAKREQIAVAEANKLEIPVVAIVDTNCDPEVVDYPIPGNDDAIRSISLITRLIARAVQEGRETAEAEEQLSEEEKLRVAEA